MVGAQVNNTLGQWKCTRVDDRVQAEPRLPSAVSALQLTAVQGILLQARKNSQVDHHRRAETDFYETRMGWNVRNGAPAQR
jgi:hypothetical protein